MRTLVVTNPFAGYEHGEHITDPDTIEDILDGEHSGHVVSVNQPDED